jgi:hypothetical protein
MPARLSALALLALLSSFGCSLERAPIFDDAGLDASFDAPPGDAADAPRDTPRDTREVDGDLPIDTGLDAPVDSGVDAPTDTGVDAPIDPCSLCEASEMCCAGVCIDTTADPLHCGSCDPCAAAANATPTCAASTCGLSCAADFDDCNATYADGCEADLGAVGSCNACGNVCPDYLNTTESCAPTGCAYACTGGLSNCDASTPECETDTNTSALHCGACGNACGPAQSCSGGVCRGWRALPTTGAPSARVDHVALWTGTEMVIWSGQDASGELGDGALFNPATNTWRAITNTGAPSARRGAAAVWTGTRMIVWSGYREGSGWLDSGGVYDPATNTWAALTATGTPAARSRAAAAWTGADMIVWGGWVGATNVTNTGAAWAPGDAAWNGTPSSGLSSRAYPGGVWTGSRFVVWGGDNRTGTRYGDGARFDPTADTWAPITATDAPSARTQHAMVWVSGAARVIAWGGLVGNGAGGDIGSVRGGRYDPVANTWAETALPMLTGRLDVAAIGTSDAMVVFGGRSDEDGGYTVFADGGRYDPVADSWTILPTAGAPSARYSATAVWTGSEMIVFGGRSPTDAVLGVGGVLGL